MQHATRPGRPSIIHTCHFQDSGFLVLGHEEGFEPLCRCSHLLGPLVKKTQRLFQEVSQGLQLSKPVLIGWVCKSLLSCRSGRHSLSPQTTSYSMLPMVQQEQWGELYDNSCYKNSLEQTLSMPTTGRSAAGIAVVQVKSVCQYAITLMHAPTYLTIKVCEEGSVQLRTTPRCFILHFSSLCAQQVLDHSSLTSGLLPCLKTQHTHTHR